MSNREHWDRIYADKTAEQLSWYRPRLEQSLAWIDRSDLAADARIVDVGGGASTLVDDLLARGFTRVSVVDLSARALERARERLGERAQEVRWVVGDVTTAMFDRATSSPVFEDGSVDLWHDRAVFHFLVDADARVAYVERVTRALRPGGLVILASFAQAGPDRCSGLPVVRYDAAELATALGPGFELVDHAEELHHTPSGAAQAFAYVLCRRRGA
jgi:SAM-dependent methyltransferase